MIKPFRFVLVALVLLTCISLTITAQQPAKDYKKQWKTIDSLVQRGLPKSALDEARKLYQLTKKDKQTAQQLKTLIYIMGLQRETREDNQQKAIAEMEQEISTATEPAKSILYSLLADMYWVYYNNYRYQLYNRTNTVAAFKKDDIDTWTIDDFHKKITELFFLSLQNKTVLKQTKISSFKPVVITGNVTHLRPTLFDLLAHEALIYFHSDERYISKPAYAFEIRQESAFAPAAEFVKQKFTTNDSLSLQHKALLLFQELISFHLNDANPEALIDADIERIQYVQQKSVAENKTELYLNALSALARKYEKHPAADQALYLVAQWYSSQADAYVPYGDSTYRLGKVKAKEICEKVITRKDSSEGKINCSNLLISINAKELRFNIEKVNLPNKAFRALIEYSNLSELYLRVVKANKQKIQATEGYIDDPYWNEIVSIKPIKEWTQSLIDPKDYLEHKAEIKVDGLPAGEYMLIISSDKNFDYKKGVLGARIVYISTISYVNSGNNFFVLNRQSGQPLANAAVQVWNRVYDYKTYKYRVEKAETYKTDNRGYFIMDPKKRDKNNPYYLLDISWQNEQLYIADQQYDYYYSDAPPPGRINENIVTFHFLDRAIYRPGQTLYFKGIVMDHNAAEKTNAIKSNYKATVYLTDANYQLIDSIKVTTNEYGSYSGKFQLPQTGLTGIFYLHAGNFLGRANFRVEEYKRPKFYVDYEKIKNAFRVNDKITITGFAKAYAGNNIDGASVKYRVVRKPRFIYSWMFWKWRMPATTQMEIAHGETKTDKDGKFKIDFVAIPDSKIDKKFDPVFDYYVYADITDINGETRSGQEIVTVGYKSLFVNISMPDKMTVDSFNTLNIITSNLADQFQSANLKVSISKLKEEKRLIRKRYWERPDQFIMSKDEYIRHFPFDEYDNETDYRTWPKDKEIYQKTDSSKQDHKWSLGNLKPEEGYYIIEITTKDKDGQEVKQMKYVELYDPKSNKLNREQYLWAEGGKPIEPGERSTISIGSSADSVYLIQHINKPKSNDFSYLSLNNEKKILEFSATEADRGGYHVTHLFVKNNRFYSSSNMIVVPWTNKDLTIEYATFRDKTLPGSEEKWKIKITGYKNEKVAAEMLASMYDASLDQFVGNTWNKPSIWPYYYQLRSWAGDLNFTRALSNQRYYQLATQKPVLKIYDRLLSGPYDDENRVYTIRRELKSQPGAAPVLQERAKLSANEVSVSFKKDMAAANQNADPGSAEEDGMGGDVPEQGNQQDNSAVQIRTNFNETAFFFPDLHTDSTGAIEFSFTLPDALTKWKFQALAHTKDLSIGVSDKEIITQKDLMVQPNAPRFLREGDKMEFTSKIVNLTDKELTGQAELQLIDATTNQPVDGWFQNVFPNQYFTVSAGQSQAVKFPIQVPYLFNKALTWRIIAKSGQFSDGEENAMPVLTNKMLVTETMPLNVRGTGTKQFKFEKLLNGEQSETLQHYALTLEYSSNPAWYAVQALPYLMEYPYECAEQNWNRYYANSLATMIANSSPRIKQIFEQWKTKDTAALLSNLQKNQELKSVLLEETPWVLQAKTEEQQKKNIALLFDLVKMSSELNNTYEKLRQMQSQNGGFVWFKGGPDDRYMTQYIVTGIGHLKKLNAVTMEQARKLKAIVDDAMPYLDKKIKEDYDLLVKNKVDLKTYSPGYTIIQYLYMRSFFTETAVAKASQTAYDYFRKQAKTYWTKQSKYMQGMIALALSRTNDTKTPADILKSLKETSISNDELGMYWKDQTTSGWFWHQAPVEMQALMIEAFQEIAKDVKTVDDLKTWLLKNKQTTNWRTTKATAEACYALLLQGSQWLVTENEVVIKLGNVSVSSASGSEAGTGYFKKTIDGNAVKPDMGNISVTVAHNNSTSQTSWGGVYWQYFENLDKITPASTPLKLSKKLFVEKNTDRGPVLTPVNEGDELKIGDKIKVRVELRVDRDMEYVHMKDMRASSLEPVNVLSSYKWQGGLGYYESTRDASTNFFFNYLRKGTYVFEYSLFTTHAGNFSNGVTTIQCMYAPEFTSHSEGIRINVVE